MFERHSLKVNGYSAIAPKRVTKKQLQKQRKASGNGAYNLIKYVRCHHHTRCEATMCPVQILTSQPSNTDFEITNCVRNTYWEGASNKKSIR
jgi:hypothetical protein